MKRKSCLTKVSKIVEKTKIIPSEKSQQVSNERIECDLCAKQFQRQSALNFHIKKQHLDQHQNECPICGNIVKRLKLHMKTVHPDPENLIKCDLSL